MMEIKVKLNIHFDDDHGTIITKTLWIKNIPGIDPTHAIIHGVILEAKT